MHPSMPVSANPATATAFAQRGANSDKVARMLLSPKDGDLGAESTASRPRSDAKDFGLLSPYLKLNPPAGKLAALMGLQSSESSLPGDSA